MRTSKYFTLTAALFVLAIGVQSVAHADQFSDSGFYIGGGYGLAKMDGGDFDDDVDFPTIFAGFQILPFLGIEAAYYDFGEYGNSLISAETEGYSLALTGRIPITSTLAIFAKIGPMWSDTDFDAGPFSESYDNEELLAGAGVSFEVTDNLDIRIAYDWVDLDLDADDLSGLGSGDFESELNLLTVGLQLEF